MRSILTDKFTPFSWAQFEKQYKRKLKEDNTEKISGNVMINVTLGVIDEKTIPDIDDCLLLIREGSLNKSDEAIKEKIDAWMERDNNKERGYTGMFCDVCKDLVMDLPINKEFADRINMMEEYINNKVELQNKMSDINKLLSGALEKLGDAVKNIDNKDADTEVKAEDAEVK